jgi:hypothetical protein
MVYEIENRYVRKSVHQFLEVFDRFTVARLDVDGNHAEPNASTTED